jgi:hypothetical protein
MKIKHDILRTSYLAREIINQRPEKPLLYCGKITKHMYDHAMLPWIFLKKLKTLRLYLGYYPRVRYFLWLLNKDYEALPWLLSESPLLSLVIK